MMVNIPSIEVSAVRTSSIQRNFMKKCSIYSEIIIDAIQAMNRTISYGSARCWLSSDRNLLSTVEESCDGTLWYLCPIWCLWWYEYKDLTSYSGQGDKAVLIIIHDCHTMMDKQLSLYQKRHSAYFYFYLLHIILYIHILCRRYSH